MKLNKNTKEAKEQKAPLPKIQRKLKMNDPFLKLQRKPKSRKYKRAFSERPPPSCPNALLQNTSFIRTDKSLHCHKTAPSVEDFLGQSSPDQRGGRRGKGTLVAPGGQNVSNAPSHWPHAIIMPNTPNTMNASHN